LARCPHLRLYNVIGRFYFNQMRYEDKFIEHKATKHTPKWKEIVANVEFSEGDLVELVTILNESENSWGKELVNEIEKSFEHRRSLNAL